MSDLSGWRFYARETCICWASAFPCCFEPRDGASLNPNSSRYKPPVCDFLCCNWSTVELEDDEYRARLAKHKDASHVHRSEAEGRSREELAEEPEPVHAPAVRRAGNSRRVAAAGAAKTARKGGKASATRSAVSVERRHGRGNKKEAGRQRRSRRRRRRQSRGRSRHSSRWSSYSGSYSYSDSDSYSDGYDSDSTDGSAGRSQGRGSFSMAARPYRNPPGMLPGAIGLGTAPATTMGVPQTWRPGVAMPNPLASLPQPQPAASFAAMAGQPVAMMPHHLVPPGLPASMAMPPAAGQAGFPATAGGLPMAAAPGPMSMPMPGTFPAPMRTAPQSANYAVGGGTQLGRVGEEAERASTTSNDEEEVALVLRNGEESKEGPHTAQQRTPRRRRDSFSLIEEAQSRLRRRAALGGSSLALKRTHSAPRLHRKARDDTGADGGADEDAYDVAMQVALPQSETQAQAKEPVVNLAIALQEGDNLFDVLSRRSIKPGGTTDASTEARAFNLRAVMLGRMTFRMQEHQRIQEIEARRGRFV